MLARAFRLAVAASLVLPGATVSAQSTDSLWTIKGGTYAGRMVSIDNAAATRRGSRFWRVSTVGGERRVVGWNPSRLPAQVAFRPGYGVTSADSIAFWDILRRMEEDMGMRLFEPASLSPDSDPDDVIVVDTKAMPSADGLTLVTWAASGSLYDARVHLRSRETLHNARVVTHEMMHTLGFGHTSAWNSVMNGYGGSPQRLTPEDIAYAQVALESRASSERLDMWARLALAVERESPAAAVRDGAELCLPEVPRVRTPTSVGSLAIVPSCSDGVQR